MPRSDPAPHIVVVGSTNLDLITYTPRIPEAGETIVGDRFVMGFGGKGANQAVMARLLGARVTMANCVGDDIYGEMTRANLDEFGIDLDHVHVAPGSSGVAPIWVEPDGTNRIVIVPGANHSLTPEQARRAIDADARVVVGQFEIPQSVTAAAFAEARARGALTVLNPAPAASIDPDLLGVTDWLIPNEVELRTIGAGDGFDDDALAATASELGCRLLVTLGSAGAALVTRDRKIRRFAAPEVTPRDTTGAGDAFVAAFAYGLASGWDEEVAVRLGILCAADSVTREGTQTSFPRAEAIEQLIRQAIGD